MLEHILARPRSAEIAFVLLLPPPPGMGRVSQAPQMENNETFGPTQPN